MTGPQDLSQSKSIGNLAREAAWFLTHSLLALLMLVAVIIGMTLNHPDPEAVNPKLLATLLAFIVPIVGGFLIAWRIQNDIAAYVWISGLVVFAIVCVRVLDLPTGNGLCKNCGAVDKLWRTFFSIRNGSGLMAGDGLLVGTWIPLSMIAYAVGARFGLDS